MVNQIVELGYSVPMVKLKKPSVKILINSHVNWLITLKLSIWEFLPALFTLLFAQSRISASLISLPALPWECDLKFLSS